MSGRWDTARAKNQLRAATGRLAQLQRQIDLKAQITSKDLAALLTSRKLVLARAKALDLITEEKKRNVLNALEVSCDVLFWHSEELEKTELKRNPSITEAVACILFTTPHVECREVNGVRDMLVSCTDPAFVRSASRNLDGHISPRIVNFVRPEVSNFDINACLQKIARTFGADWEPPSFTDNKASILSDMLDAFDETGSINIDQLRTLAKSGLPDNPSWLRSRVWKLLLGYTPSQKSDWKSEWRKKRDGYHDLVRRQLEIIVSMSLPESPLSDSDLSLLNILESLTRVPTGLFEGLEREPVQSADCPLHDVASPRARVSYSSALDERLRLIHMEQSRARQLDQCQESAADQGLNIGLQASSEISAVLDDLSVATPGGGSVDSLQSSRPRVVHNVPAHISHISALTRILNVHRALHPTDAAAVAPHLASLLVPLYNVMLRDVDLDQLAHAEADTFWLFEVLLREISDPMDREVSLAWLKRFAEKLTSVDRELAEDLRLKGLDPAQPQFSYRWIVPVLSHTLPFSSLLRAWDAIISRPEASRQDNPKLERLLDICTAMLVQARSRLLSFGKSERKYDDDWNSHTGMMTSQQLLPWELSDAFTKGMEFLQYYPINEMGGIDLMLQSAEDMLLIQKVNEGKKHADVGTLTFGTRLANTVWRGFTNQIEHEDSSSEATSSEEEDESSTENENSLDASVAPSSSQGWASKLTSTVVRGITNQSAMEDEARSPTLSRANSTEDIRSDNDTSSLSSKNNILSKKLSTPSIGSNLWGYAAKLAQSDLAASLSKATTNISAKTVSAWTPNASTVPNRALVDVHSTPHSPAVPVHSVTQTRRAGSVPNIAFPDGYSPPPRPLFFRERRNSHILTQRDISSLQLDDIQEPSASTFSPRIRPVSLKTAIASWSGISKPSRSAPKPLLLNASSLITKAPEQIGASISNARVPHGDQRVNGLRDPANHSLKRWTSYQSLSPMTSPRPRTISSSVVRSDIETDASTSSSRIVTLDRRSLSPMAQKLKAQRDRSVSISSRSEQMRRPRVFGSRPTNSAELQSDTWRSAKLPDSPSTTPSSPPPWTPMIATGLEHHTVSVANSEQESSAFTEEEEEGSVKAENFSRRFKRPLAAMRFSAIQESMDAWSDSSAHVSTPVISVAARARAIRHGPQTLLTSLPAFEADEGVVTRSLATPEFDSDIHDMVMTPKAEAFFSTSPAQSSSLSPRKPNISADSRDRRQKNFVAADTTGSDVRQARMRKSPSEKRESMVNDGDDEGYDDLLGAYDSETSLSSRPYESDE